MGFSSRLGRAIGTPLEVRQETQGPFPVATWILGFLSIFKRSQTSSPFEALNSAFLSSCQRDVGPPFEMRWGTKAFPRVSTGHSDIPSCCEIKDEPAFKTVQGNQDLFRVRASQCRFHLGQHTPGPSHIPIVDRSLLLRCDWKVGIPLEVKQAPQEEPSLSNRYLRGTLNLLHPVHGYRDSLTRKKVEFPCSGLNAGLSFISQYKGMSEYSVQSLEKALGSSLI